MQRAKFITKPDFNQAVTEQQNRPAEVTDLTFHFSFSNSKNKSSVELSELSNTHSGECGFSGVLGRYQD